MLVGMCALVRTEMLCGGRWGERGAGPDCPWHGVGSERRWVHGQSAGAHLARRGRGSGLEAGMQACPAARPPQSTPRRWRRAVAAGLRGGEVAGRAWVPQGGTAQRRQAGLKQAASQLTHGRRKPYCPAPQHPLRSQPIHLAQPCTHLGPPRPGPPRAAQHGARWPSRARRPPGWPAPPG